MLLHCKILSSILSILNLKKNFLHGQNMFCACSFHVNSMNNLFFSFRKWPGLVLSRLFVSSPHFSLLGDCTKLENLSFFGPITKSTELHLLQFLVIDSLKIHSGIDLTKRKSDKHFFELQVEPIKNLKK